MCACAPVLGPIFGPIFQKIKVPDKAHRASYKEDHSSGQNSEPGRSKEFEDSYPLAAPKTSTTIEADMSAGALRRLEGKKEEGDPLGWIQVERDWQVRHA